MRESSCRLSRGELRLQGLKELRQPLDVQRAVDVGQRAREREPVLERVAGAGRRLRAIAQHPPFAFGGAAEIDRVEAQVRAARRATTPQQRPQEFRIAGDQCRRQPAVANQLGRTVDIGQHGLKQRGALR